MSLFYFSGVVGDTVYSDRVNKMLTHRLFSMEYMREWDLYFARIDDLRPRHEVSLMLDSGAFTVFRSRKPDIQVEDLARRLNIIMKQAEGFKTVDVINLDKIPGEWGKQPTKDQLEEAIDVSNRNYETLRAEFGDCIMPVFHQTESEAQLDHILAYKAPYVCISPQTGKASQKAQFNWAQRVLDKANRVCRTHGLAVTGSLTVTSPYYSVDSASAVMQSVYGLLHTPQGYIGISEKSHGQRHFNQAWSTLRDKSYVERVCKELGLEIKELQTEFAARMLFNCYFFKEMIEGASTNNYKQESLFEL
jgi:hypothetical protein